jgi:hypothetical protein
MLPFWIIWIARCFSDVFCFRFVRNRTVIVRGAVLRCISLEREDTNPANNSGWSMLWLFICWVSWPVRGRSAGKGSVDSSLVTVEFCIVPCVLRISLCFWDWYKTEVIVAFVKFDFCQTPLFNIQVLSDITPWWLVNSYRVFRRACWIRMCTGLWVFQKHLFWLSKIWTSLMSDTLSARTWCRRQLWN